MPETQAGSVVTAAEHQPMLAASDAPMAAAEPAAAISAVVAVAVAAPYQAPAVAEAPAPVPTVAPPPAPAPGPQAAPVRTEPYVLQTDTLASLAAAAGLQWVQSDADKISAVRAALVAEPTPLHVPREPRRHVLVDDGPLVLVETRKDLSQLKLPFEQQRSV